MRADDFRLYYIKMAWWKFLLISVLLVLFIVGEWLLTVLMMTVNLPVVVWNHLKALHRDTYRGKS